ncbi:hypothetical protein NEISICOT_02232 [Neisseria sicca ATCC 29256]|uniref:Uncharacterized protein n=1 Tax=Neisseria sicca ATCC 29256 TaxID=547045 RepID=C6M6S9_NEISI|nr:hypothetical protein NEISICOT_02232 [Neisseria sicca ATCC 29256]
MRHRFAGFATYSSGFRLNASSLRLKANQAFDFSDDLKPFHQYSGLTKSGQCDEAADSTDSTEPIHLVLQHLRESFSLS